jgi:hypothetical protein
MILLGAAAAVVTLFAVIAPKVSALKKIEFNMAKTRIYRDKNKPKEKGKLHLIIALNVTNTGNREVELKRFTGNLFLQGNLVANMNFSFDPNTQADVVSQVLLPQTNTTILMPTTVKTMNLVGTALSTLLSIFSGGSPTVYFRLKGKLTAGGLSDLPIDETFKYFD